MKKKSFKNIRSILREHFSFLVFVDNFNFRVLPSRPGIFSSTSEEHMNNNEVEAAEKSLGVTTYSN